MIPAQIRGGRGVVPLLTMPWFHGKITREESEHMLSQMVNGLFLVRESTHFPGDYTLSICSDKAIEHYRIQKDEKNKQLTIDEDSYFDNLAELIAHYEADADGLVARCIKPVKKKGNIEVVVNQNDFVQSGWMIRREDLKFEELIGKGEFSEVHKAICGGREVAVKIVKDSGMAQMFLAEASVMTSLRHPNLVELLGVVLGDVIYIVTEFMSKGSLVDYLRTRGRSVIAASDQIRFARDTCSGMAHLETKSIVHRDLAARNVLIHENATAKVSDFGLALPFDSTYQCGGKIPIKWTAPEAVKEGKFTSKSDVWSFGILLWEVYSFGRVPYPKIQLADVMSHLDTGYRMPPPDGCPPEVYSIMQQTWQKDPSRRPSFREMLGRLVDLCSTAV